MKSMAIRFLLWRLILNCFLVHSVRGLVKSNKPNIILILADDLGWNDVSFHGSQQIPTPNIDKLARSGVILNNYYVSQLCTPTRSAIMTGRHPIHTGLQDGVILGPQPYGLGLDETLLSQYLKGEGYDTHAFGKWHLGFFEKEYTPTYRGFDTFYGYYCGKGDYWDHSEYQQGYWGLDIRDGVDPVWTQWGNYSTDMYTEMAISRVLNHDQHKPMFLYLAYQAVHSANFIDPLQAPPALINKFAHIQDMNRRIYAAMVASMDMNIGKLVDTLHATGMYDNSVIIFSTDNGGPANGYDANAASNFPLRGVKSTMWEGGVRGASFVHSPLLDVSGRVSMDLLHVTDWLPTIYGLAGGDVSKLTRIDGYDAWKTISRGAESPRDYVLHNIDSRNNDSALRVGDWKLLINRNNINWDGWYAPPEMTKLDSSPNDGVVKCGTPPKNASHCTDVQKPCLFNIAEDPCEFYDRSAEQPDIVQDLIKKLNELRSTMVKPRNTGSDPQSNPKLHGGVWSPWKDKALHP